MTCASYSCCMSPYKTLSIGPGPVQHRTISQVPRSQSYGVEETCSTQLRKKSSQSMNKECLHKKDKALLM